jgi:hypothetical protein
MLRLQTSLGGVASASGSATRGGWLAPARLVVLATTSTVVHSGGDVKRTRSLTNVEKLNAAGVVAGLTKDGELDTGGGMEEVAQRCNGSFVSDRWTR